eukprot:CAMPEP_0201547804 /NCGR_PEP_ID=MMETSP0173_2-20130828/4315_1 /ASSEMBLY_ACC=CAM_ASM_000268 /TAXON_ID=218659 /ORGANISM="Vexillifera sp., Strain DIVA3 564/2" /LENGTH=53 /DNA_ID=CAMNT_0047956977 /DNA_START=318 /DNA_END=479 /DNA_ORIENTATION=+
MTFELIARQLIVLITNTFPDKSLVLGISLAKQPISHQHKMIQEIIASVQSKLN